MVYTKFVEPLQKRLLCTLLFLDNCIVHVLLLCERFSIRAALPRAAAIMKRMLFK